MALSIAVIALGAGVLYVAVGGAGKVAGTLGSSFSGFVQNVTATATPAPTVEAVSDAPLLAAPDEPYVNSGKVELIVTVPSSVVGDPNYKIRVYLALKDQTPSPILDVPIATTTPKTVVPMELEKGINDFTVTIVGPGGTESDTSPVVRYVLDTAVPKITITSPKDGAKVNGKSLDIKGKVQARSTLIVHNTDNNASITGTAKADGTFLLKIALRTGTNHITINATDPAGNVTDKAFTVRRGTGKLQAVISASDYRVSLKDLPQERPPGLLGDRPRRQGDLRCRRHLHPQHPGDLHDHVRRQDQRQWPGRLPDDDPVQGGRQGSGQRHVSGVDRRIRVHRGLHGHHDHQVVERSFAGHVAAQRRRSYHPPMPMWRCPHCGTPQAETAHCWVCRRSSTACLTCRHYRRSVAAKIGYCGLDSHRLPLHGDEIRPCWEAGRATAAPSIGAVAPPDLLAIAPRTASTRLEFIEVVARRDGPASPSVKAGDPIADLAPLVPETDPARWSLWGDDL